MDVNIKTAALLSHVHVFSKTPQRGSSSCSYHSVTLEQTTAAHHLLKVSDGAEQTHCDSELPHINILLPRLKFDYLLAENAKKSSLVFLILRSYWTSTAAHLLLNVLDDQTLNTLIKIQNWSTIILHTRLYSKEVWNWRIYSELLSCGY